MKKWVVVLVVVLVFFYYFTGGYTGSPLHGKLKAVTITKINYINSPANSLDWKPQEISRRIDDAQTLSEIEQALRGNWQYYTGISSMETSPKYTMKVEYVSGTTEEFHFTPIEWGPNGHPSHSFLDLLKKNGI